MTTFLQRLANYECVHGKLPDAYRLASLVAESSIDGSVTAVDAGPEVWLRIQLATGESYDAITQLDGSVTIDGAE